jgi:two-component system, sensor histidine kinase and response regulator
MQQQALEIPQHVLEKWQGFADTMTELIGVPAGRIARIAGSSLEILISAGTPENPYRAGERLPLTGLYCESVLRDRSHLLIADASASAQWRGSPDAARGMVSYLGFPIFRPDGTPFGTVCVFDRAPRSYTAAQSRLIEQFRGVMEDHLALIEVEDLRAWAADFAEAKTRQQEIRLDEERYRLLVDNSVDHFFLHDDRGRIFDVNQQACRHLGYSRAGLLRQNMLDFSASSNHKELEELWRETQPGASVAMRDSHRRKDGTIFPVEIHISCLQMDERKLFFTMARDISERLEAEQAVQKLNAELEQRVAERTLQWRKSADLLQAVMDGATDAIFVKDLDGRFLLFNRAAADFASVAAREVLGKTAADLFGDATAGVIRQHELEVMRTGAPATVEESVPLGGRPRRFLATRSPYRDPDGRIMGIIGISRDMTEKIRAEEALRESDARWQFAVDGAGDGIWDWNVETGHVFFSPQWKAMLGYSEDDVGNTVEDWSKRVHPDDLAECWRVIEDHFKRNTSDFSMTHRMRAKDGSWKWIMDRGKVMKRALDGRPLRAIGTHTDITTHKITENELRLERERLTLATEASHLGVWEYDLEANHMRCDERWYEIFGIESRSSVNSIEAFNQCVHPEDIARVTRERLEALAARKKIHRDEYRTVTPSGELRWITSSACLIERTDLTPLRMVGIVMDVTESRLAERRLQQSYESLRQAERLAKIGSWTLDLATGQFSCSDMLYDMTGADPGGPALTPDDLQKMLAPDSYRKINAAIAKCAETGEPYNIRVDHLRPDRTSFAAHIRIQANRDASGQIASLTGTLQDITEREEARAQLAALADNLPNGAIYRLEQDVRGQYAMPYVSAGVLALIGTPADEIMQDRDAFLRTIHEEDLPRYQAAVEHSRATREVFDCQFRARTRDGRLIWMHCRSAPRLQWDGTLVWDGIMLDITAERQASEALQQAKETAVAAEQAKSGFLATMSHEIRTPMNTVIGMTRLTLQTDLGPKQRNYLEKIDASAKTLLSVIDDILDFSKIEAGKMVLEDAEFTIEAVLESVSAVTAMRAEEKGLEIAYSISPAVPHKLRGDPLRLGQVLTNLISNAVKFTHAGEVVISIGVAPGTGATTTLQFAIRDTGIGLDADQIAGLFKPFAQASSQTSRHYGGTGLGLAICKQLIEGMGGKIEVESAPGRGSIFHFTIETAVPAREAVSPSANSRPRYLEGRRVLIVDDNASARAILLEMVRAFGMAAAAVESGSKALAALRMASRNNEPFDLVLMDWRMPTMDGLETARRIKTEDKLRRMPAVLMVTAYGREEVLRQVEQIGLQGLLIKPVTESVLFNTITDILSDSPTFESTRNLPVRRELLPNEVLSMLTGRRVLVVDDNALNREVACDFLLAAGMEVDTAINGIDALRQLEAHAYDAVLMDMHMPEMDGLAATKEIRRQSRWAALPIIALTAQARVEDRQASLKAGMTTHLTKPIDETALYRTLMDVLAASAGPKARDAEAADVIDLSSAHRRLGNKPDRVERLLQGFLRDFGNAPARMDEHLRKEDAAAVASLAHVLKGAASYLDAHRFYESAEQLERAARQKDSEAMKAQAPAFQNRLANLLDQVNASLVGISPQDASSAQANTGIVLDLIAQLEPLIARGDYGAEALLEKLSAVVAGTGGEELAKEVRSQYDELELAAASAALLRLKANLQAQPGSIPL